MFAQHTKMLTVGLQFF